jgi:hypothetical protein
MTTETPRIVAAAETGDAPPNRNEVGDRIIKAAITIKVEGKQTECFMFAEEYNSDDDPLECETCEGEGDFCQTCKGTGYADANSWSVALGATPEAAQEAHANGDDAHQVAPCWCGNEGSVEERAEWLAFQAEDAGLTPYKGDDEEAVEINASGSDSTTPAGPFGFDGCGINNHNDASDPYRPRLATLTEAGHAINAGPLLAAAPELRDMVRDLRDFMALEEGDGADKEGRDMRKRMDTLLKKVGA